MKIKSKIITLLILCFIFGNLIPMNAGAEEEEEIILIYGTQSPGQVSDWDPTVAIYSRINGEYFAQILEGLFGRENNDPQGDIVGVLAESWVQDNATSFTVELRDNVKFHDGTDFDANAVKWNIDRANYIIGQNLTEETTNVDYTTGWNLHSGVLYKPVDPYRAYFTADWNLSTAPAGSLYPLIKSVEVVDDTHVKINGGGPALSPEHWVMSVGQIRMISPTYYADFQMKPFWGHENLTGTGPFKFISHDSDYGYLEKFDDYWKGPAVIDEIVFTFFLEPSALESAAITGQVDYFIGPFGDYDAIDNSSALNIIEEGLSASQIVAVMSPLIPVEVRKGLSYAIDFQSYCDVSLDGHAVVAGGAIPAGQTYQNADVNMPRLNLEIARQTMIDAYPTETTAASLTNETTSTMDALWEGLADSDPLFVFNQTHSANWRTLGIIYYVSDGAHSIGGQINSREMASGDVVNEIVFLGETVRHNMGLFYGPYGGSGDPAPFLQGAWDISAFTNWADVNDSDLNSWIYEIDMLTDVGGVKQAKIDQIANKLQNEIYPYLFINQNKNYAAMNVEWEGDPTWNRVYLYNLKPVEEETTPVIPGFQIISLIFAAFIPVVYVIRKRK